MDYIRAIAFGSGLVAMGYLVAAAFFVRFWRQTGETLFLAFGAAFVLLFISQTALSLLPNGLADNRAEVYLLRLGAYGLIAVAVLSRTPRRPRDDH